VNTRDGNEIRLSILRALAKLYAEPRAGRTGAGQRDFWWISRSCWLLPDAKMAMIGKPPSANFVVHGSSAAKVHAGTQTSFIRSDSLANKPTYLLPGDPPPLNAASGWLNSLQVSMPTNPTAGAVGHLRGIPASGDPRGHCSFSRRFGRQF
jgi:hypothetical protein